MRPEIPLEILGLVAPILSWTESSESQLFSFGWSQDGLDGDAAAQERCWLLNELPTYSLDNIDDVVAYARSEHRVPALPGSRAAARLAPPAGYDLWHVFEKLADRYLVWTGGKVAVRSGRMVELHELGLRLPLGPMVRHAHARAVLAGEQSLRDILDLPESVGLLPSSAHNLRAVVRRGLSEGHLHLNSIHTAEVAWADHLLKPLARRPHGFGQMDWRLLRLGRAAARILSLASAAALAGKAEPEHARKLLDAFDRMYFAPGFSAMSAAEERLEKTFLNALGFVYKSAWGVVVDASSGRGYLRRSRKAFDPIQDHLLRWMDPQGFPHGFSENAAGPSLVKESLSERENHLAALHVIAHLALARTYPGATALRRGKSPPPAFQFVHGALFRYLVCHTHYWQRGVQQGRTTGLSYFKRYYDSNQRWPVESTDYARAEAVFARAREWRGLRVLEGRISPPTKGASDVLHWLEAYAHGADRGRVEKLGLVVHFIKNHERWKPASRYSIRDPARFTDLRRRYRREAFRLFRLLEKPSLFSPFIVGIDAANLELATPPEVFAPVFRFLRQRPIELREPKTPDIETWRRLEDIRRLVERRRLGMTYHVGEEFRHLLSGLRAIDEVIEFLDPQAGDRLGHGIALGLAPKVWAEQVGFQAILPKLEWLDTLVWIHHLLGPGDELLGRLKIEDRIERLGRELYRGKTEADGSSRGAGVSPTLTPLMLYDAWRLRQLDPDNVIFLARNDRPSDAEDDSRERKRLRFQPLDGADTAVWRWNRIESRATRRLLDDIGVNPPVELLDQYWFSPDTRRRGEELMLVDMELDNDAWLAICRRAQERVQQRVADSQMAVEVNPSANRVIGPMNRISEHHVFDLTLGDDGRPEGRLHVTVNTDNPGTANTSLAHEYYLLGESLLRRDGVSEVDVVQWLEWLRTNGEDFSFVRQLPSPNDPSMRRVIEALKSRRRPLHTLKDADAIVRELWLWIADPDLHYRPVDRDDVPKRLKRHTRRIFRLESR